MLTLETLVEHGPMGLGVLTQRLCLDKSTAGTLRPHWVEELKQPDANYGIGMKSHVRAPTFLMLTDYEQARLVVVAIAGDWEGARRVELLRPETGLCSTEALDDGAASSCGPPIVGPTAVTLGSLRPAARASSGSCC
jgi:hypothetical protein